VKVKVEQEIGGRNFSLTTGEWAKQASGAVIAQYDETVLFVAAQSGPARPGIDFFPLQVDYRERLAAAANSRAGSSNGKAGPPPRKSSRPD
jgi:polyribonucleotide nucleotidyltransferase